MDTTVQLATLCYVRDGDRTLMLHRVKKKDDIHEGKWNGLGGKFEPGESPEQCVRREVKEESGLTLRGETMHGVLTFPRFDGERDWYVFVFTSREFDGTPWDESREGRLEWIPDDELLDLNLWEGDEYFLRWMTEEQFFSGSMTYEEESLEQFDVHFHETRSTFPFDPGPTGS